MNPISAFFVRNIIVVFFFYGLAFFVMGLALALASRRRSEFRFAQAIVPLAAFGLLHGFHEWVEMYQKIASLTSGYVPGIVDEVLRLGLLVTSLLLLLAFGVMLLVPSQARGWRTSLPIAAVAGLWGLAVLALFLVHRPASEELVAEADVLARYGIGIPAALLGAWAMMVQQRTFREHGMPRFGRDLVWCATALLLYGVVGQVFVRETHLFPSTVLNSTAFLQWFGIPVQLFRGVMAGILAVYMMRALNAFDLESQRQLESANEARLQAQADALQAERRISREMERLNEELQLITQELSLLLDLSNTLAVPMTLEQRLQEVLEKLVPRLDFPDAGMILLTRRTGPGARVLASSGYNSGEADARSSEWYRWSQDLGTRCALHPLVLCQHSDGSVMAFAFDEVLSQPHCLRHREATTVLALSLLVQEQVIGSIVLAQTKEPVRELTADELELTVGIARQLGLSVENARLYQEAQEREQRLGDLLRQAVGAQEAERQRIARELHDATGQSLTAIALGLRGVETMVDGGQFERNLLVDQVQELKDFSTNALGELRQLIADLRPSILDDMGLVATLRWYLQAFEERRGIDVRFHVAGQPTRLPSEYETVLFRIMQEAMTNVAKHARASQVDVTLAISPHEVSLAIADNGVGFDRDQVMGAQQASHGWGLLGMQERTALLGGTYQLNSAPGEGTRVQVTVPLSQQ